MARRDFIFTTEAANLTPMTRQVLDYMAEHLPAPDTKLLSKAKFIITELLTNALKHSGMPQTLLSMDIADGKVYITKKDSGAPLPIIGNGQNIAGQRQAITCDAMHILYAVYEADNKVRFDFEDGDCDSFNIQGIIEHFGLLIITKSAEEFTYEYAGGENIFRVVLANS